MQPKKATNPWGLQLTSGKFLKKEGGGKTLQMFLITSGTGKKKTKNSCCRCCCFLSVSPGPGRKRCWLTYRYVAVVVLRRLMRPMKFFLCVVAHIEGGLDAATEEEAASEQQNSVCLSGGLMRRAAPAPVSFHSQSTASVSETRSDDIFFFKAVGRLGIFCCFLSVVIFRRRRNSRSCCALNPGEPRPLRSAASRTRSENR